METAKHTPGPWQANETFINNAKNRFYVKQRGWGGELIADCGIVSEEVEANANLIAAAPELLAALHELRKEISEFTGGNLEFFIATLDKIAANTIRKAEGAEKRP